MLTPASIGTLFPGNSEIAALMRATDWAATPLGDASTWPQSLRSMIRMMLTSRYQMWLGWGPELHFFYNDAYRPTLGVKHPRSLGAPTRELWAEIWDDIGPRIQHVLDTGQATWDEGLLLLLERNGYAEETYHTFSYSPIFDDDGAVGGMLSVVTEETERIITERRLGLVRELSSRLAAATTVAEVLRAVEEAWPVAMRDLPFTLLYLFDDDGRTASLAARTGIAAGDPVAVETLDVAAAGPWPIADMLAQAQAIVVEPLPDGYVWPQGPWQRPPQAAILAPIAKQGQTRPAGVLIAGVNPHRPCDAGYRSFVELCVGQVAAALANVRAFESERQRAQALAAIDRAKTVFFSNVSHEFRTPLTLMLGPLEELAGRGDLSRDVREHVALIRRNGIRLQRLVNTLLDFSRIEAGRAQARFEPVELDAFTRELASAFESAMDRAGLRLIVDCRPIGQPVYVDRTMWEKIVLNLLSNAFKYTLAGSIEVSLQPAPGGVCLRVTDTGVGIPSSELPKLFDRFHRVEGVRGRSHEGSGIGLALVMELVKLHGGAVAVDSAVDAGSVFTVTLPLGRSHLPPESVAEGPTGAFGSGAMAFIEEAMQWLPGTPAAAVDGAPPAALEPAAERILIADDNADMRNYLGRLLGARWHVQAVATGRDALAAIHRERPHLVVTDIMMPDIDGFALVRSLRENPHTRDLPVLMLSARAGDEARMEGLEAGASEYVTKPFAARELVARVEAQLLRARVRAVEEAHARRLASVFEQAPVAIALLRGPEHVFELTNPSYRQIIGNREVMGKPLREALPEMATQGIIELFDRLYQSGDTYTARSQRIALARPDGELEDRLFDLVFQPLRDQHGQVEGLAAVGYDVTELARAREASEVANRAKDEFLAMLGHELRNPLAPIRTALQLLRLRGIKAADREREVIERQVEHLVSLVDDLLDVSRITRGKIELHCAPVETSELVAKAIETASPLLEQKAHQLRVDVPAHGLMVNVDAFRMSQVIANLLTNAAKYTEHAGRIAISAALEDGMVAVRVRDDGIGIAPDMLTRIFDLFVQERQALDRASGGLGLGLAIVRSLVRLHEGQVEAHSDGPGRGSEFVIRLPHIQAKAAHAAPVSPELLVAPPTHVRRVLVVDDNRDAAEMLASALTTFGHLSRTAADGLAALELVKEFHPDVALLDIGLPVMDGYELARRLAADPALPGLHLVAVTGYGQEHDHQRSADAGFAAHLVKPIDLQQLRAILDSLAGTPARARDQGAGDSG